MKAPVNIPLHQNATAIILVLLKKLGIQISDVMVTESHSTGLLWLKTYPQVCKSIGITQQDCSDAYDYEEGNGEPYEDEGRLFTLVVLAVNEEKDSDGFFWIEFVFFNDGHTELHIGAATPHSEYCNDIMKQICGYSKKHSCSHDEAAPIITTLLEKMKADRHCFLEFL
jgi:hypothetical protein